VPDTDSINDDDPIKLQAAFLIRCWREGERWRYSVEDVASRRRRRYDNLEELLAGIEGRLSGMSNEL
jgi:hypothetical protein